MKQVLVIENEFYARVRLDDELAERGYQSTTVKRVRDALFKMKTQLFDVLLISYDQDTNMAMRLLATLRNNGNKVPVVLLTKRPTEEEMFQLVSYRPIEVLVKPFSVRDLLQRIEQLGSQDVA